MSEELPGDESKTHLACMSGSGGRENLSFNHGDVKNWHFFVL